MYEELQVEGFLVDYERVPVTDEKSPKETDFDCLVSFDVLIFKLNEDLDKLICEVCAGLGLWVIHFSFY